MRFIIIPLFHAGSQFSFDPLNASTVPGTGAPQRLLLRHRCSAAAPEPSVFSGKPESNKRNWPSSRAVAGVLPLFGWEEWEPRSWRPRPREPMDSLEMVENIRKGFRLPEDCGLSSVLKLVSVVAHSSRVWFIPHYLILGEIVVRVHYSAFQFMHAVLKKKSVLVHYSPPQNKHENQILNHFAVLILFSTCIWLLQPIQTFNCQIKRAFVVQGNSLLAGDALS